MLESFPVYDEKLNYSEDEAKFEKVISAIKAIRNRRTEMNILPSVKAKVFIETDEKELFKASEMFFVKLASASEIEVGDKFDLPNAVTVVANGSRCFIPMDELVDKEKELARLNKEKAAVQKDIDFSGGKLNNPGFMAKAPEKQVEAEKAKLAKAQEKMAKILESIDALK